MAPISFKIDKKLSQDIPGSLGRVGILSTPHGDIHTPAFVTVGTKATVKGITPEMLQDAGAEVMLANTYHLYLQPGEEVLQKAGGLQGFSNWHGPTMTDSGGFQAFSLGVALGKNITKFTKSGQEEMKLEETSATSRASHAVSSASKGNNKNGTNDQQGQREAADESSPMKPAQIDANGVMFRSVIDGSVHYFTPERSMQIQHNIGADIIFAFDECTSPNEPYAYQAESLDRTHRWAKQSLEYHRKALDPHAGSHLLRKQDGAAIEVKEGALISERQAIFGIVQGGRHEKLRKESATVLAGMDFDGYGIGGSFAKEDMGDAVRWVNEILPEEKPRHLLGIGEAEDLFEAVENGCDLFDCVMPTRNGRTGTLLTKYGKVNMANAKYKDDFGPLEEGCECYACKNYTRAYLNHLFKAKEMLGGTLATVHNLYFTINLVKKMRAAMIDGTFAEFKAGFLAAYLKRK